MTHGAWPFQTVLEHIHYAVYEHWHSERTKQYLPCRKRYVPETFDARWYCSAYGDYIRQGLDWQRDLLDHTQLQLQCVTMYTLYNTTVDHNTRLATAPQPVFHCNQLCWLPRQGPGPPADPTLLFSGDFTNSEINSATTVATNSYGIPSHHSLWTLLCNC
jgi:hypothetical protein